MAPSLPFLSSLSNCSIIDIATSNNLYIYICIKNLSRRTIAFFFLIQKNFTSLRIDRWKIIYKSPNSSDMISLRVILSRESPIGNEFDNCSRSKEKQLHPVAKNYLGNEFDNCSRKKQLHPKELFESFEFLIDSKGGGRIFLRYFIGEEEVLSANNTKIPFFPPSFRIGLFFPIVSLERRATEK